eukprot:1009186-Pelagomonas_calceolata.AAC.4
MAPLQPRLRRLTDLRHDHRCKKARVCAFRALLSRFDDNMHKNTRRVKALRGPEHVNQSKAFKEVPDQPGQ